MNTLAEELQQEGELKNARQVLLILAQSRFDLLPQYFINNIKSI